MGLHFEGQVAHPEPRFGGGTAAGASENLPTSRAALRRERQRISNQVVNRAAAGQSGVQSLTARRRAIDRRLRQMSGGRGGGGRGGRGGGGRQ